MLLITENWNIKTNCITLRSETFAGRNFCGSAQPQNLHFTRIKKLQKNGILLEETNVWGCL